MALGGQQFHYTSQAYICRPVIARDIFTKCLCLVLVSSIQTTGFYVSFLPTSMALLVENLFQLQPYVHNSNYKYNFPIYFT